MLGNEHQKAVFAGCQILNIGRGEPETVELAQYDQFALLVVAPDVELRVDLAGLVLFLLGVNRAPFDEYEMIGVRAHGMARRGGGTRLAFADPRPVANQTGDRREAVGLRLSGAGRDRK